MMTYYSVILPWPPDLSLQSADSEKGSCQKFVPTEYSKSTLSQSHFIIIFLILNPIYFCSTVFDVMRTVQACERG